MKTIRLFIALSLLSFNLSAQIIYSFAPTSATAAGSTFTILGENFSAIPEENSVEFQDTSASVLSATETSLTLVVTNGAISGPVSVTVDGKYR
ncbi:IPT/TIG domain-containing protein [Moheibacter sediminis]|uniref:IPT/TIG domain-containing protein n=1 Tax=Moheibacter sediminis TaxID=1434700 RepID=A0A1W1YL98_9FLAO|nr:IPT/TIG domain-containing protein [Moheibacter sediminis]SMC36893.1 IPT/TIG domain-containing protein [Moheibacter sediminis]